MLAYDLDAQLYEYEDQMVEIRAKCNSLEFEVERLNRKSSFQESQIEDLEKKVLDKNRLERTLEEAKQKLYDRSSEIQNLQETVDQMQRAIANPAYMLKGFFRAVFNRG